jgi:bacteriocin biosynthesis cyclodehydratase domain-containing protein
VPDRTLTDDAPTGGPRRWLAAGLDVIPVGEDLLVQTDTAALRLEGGVATVVRDRLLSALHDGPDDDTLRARLADLPAAELDRLLDHLVGAGVVLEDEEDRRDGWLSLVAGSRAERAALAAQAETGRVVLIGQGRAATLTAEVLANAGLRPADLVDPAGLDRAAASDLVRGNDFVLTVVDRRLSAVRHWVNAAGLEAGVPTLHVDIRGHRADIGPLVLPGQGPCHMCWRMRALACADDFPLAMAREETLDGVRRPPEAGRPVFPTLPSWVASVAGHEILALVLGVARPRLAGAVLTLDAIELTEGVHPVLPRPDCPVCAKKDRPPRNRRVPFSELVEQPRRNTDFEAIRAAVLSPVCGLVRDIDQVPKDLDEPPLPVIVQTRLANAQFLPGDHGFVGCCGKGPTPAVACDLALAEALERYSALTWQPDEQVHAVRADLDGPALDPRDLVLYADHQYADLPYPPYTDDTELDWVPAYSVALESAVWVPLSAVHIGLPPGSAPPLFPGNSNGFAAGATLRDAVLAALLEVVERDAMLMAWTHRLPGRRYAATDIPDPQTAEVAAGYARRGVRIDVHLLPTDSVVTVAMAIGWADHAPAAVVGLGAGTDATVAARRAVLEVAQVRPALKGRLRMPETGDRLAKLVADPSLVADLSDHDLLYADPATAGSALGFFRQTPLERPEGFPRLPASPASMDGELHRVVRSLIDVAGDVLYVDVTAEDVAPLGIRVAKAIVPGFQPIHFGAREMRLGHRRLREAPWRMGLRDAPADLADLNLAPHPVA